MPVKRNIVLLKWKAHAAACGTVMPFKRNSYLFIVLILYHSTVLKISYKFETSSFAPSSIIGY